MTRQVRLRVFPSISCEMVASSAWRRSTTGRRLLGYLHAPHHELERVQVARAGHPQRWAPLSSRRVGGEIRGRPPLTPERARAWDLVDHLLMKGRCLLVRQIENESPYGDATRMGVSDGGDNRLIDHRSWAHAGDRLSGGGSRHNLPSPDRACAFHTSRCRSRTPHGRPHLATLATSGPS